MKPENRQNIKTVPKNLNFMLLRYFFSFPLSEYKMRCNKNPKRRRRPYFASFFDLFYITEIFLCIEWDEVI